MSISNMGHPSADGNGNLTTSPEANVFKAVIIAAIHRYGKDGGSHEIEEIAEFRFRQMRREAQSGVDKAWHDLVMEAYAVLPDGYYPPIEPPPWVPTELELAGMPFTARTVELLDASEKVCGTATVTARTDGEMLRRLAELHPAAYGFGRCEAIGSNVVALRPSAGE